MSLFTLVALVTLWALPPLIAGAIAHRKGLDVSDHIITGVFIGVFAIVIAMWREPNWLALEERRIRDGQAKRCAWCFQLMHPAARLCPWCHAWFDPPQNLTR